MNYYKMDRVTRIKQALSILSKDPEKRYVQRSPIRNRQLHFLENLDWYYFQPTQMFRGGVYKYASFDSDGVPTHDADGNKLDVSEIQRLRKEWERQKDLSGKLEEVAMSEIYRRERGYVFPSFGSDGKPTRDADGNILDVYVMEELRKVQDREKKLSDMLEKLALQYIY
jgi:hypothetical protein